MKRREELDADRSASEKRPLDMIGAAIMVVKIATGEKTEQPVTNRAEFAAEKRAQKRADSLSPINRNEIANKAATTR